MIIAQQLFRGFAFFASATCCIETNNCLGRGLRGCDRSERLRSVLDHWLWGRRRFGT